MVHLIFQVRSGINGNLFLILSRTCWIYKNDRLDTVDIKRFINGSSPLLLRICCDKRDVFRENITCPTRNATCPARKDRGISFKYIKEIVAKENIRWELSGRDSGAIAVSGSDIAIRSLAIPNVVFRLWQENCIFYHRTRGRLIYVNSWS